jgi:hypothetical protein
MEKLVRKLQGELDAIPGGTKGSIRVHWLRGPFFNSFWLKDSYDASAAVAHVELTIYGDVSKSPCFPISRYGDKSIKNLREQFEHVWQESAESPSPYDKEK